MATSKTSNKATNVPTLKVKADSEAAVKILSRDSARSRSLKLAMEFNGKPLADFQAAWVAAASGGGVHHEASVFTKGTSKSKKAHQDFSGWLSFLKRNGFVSIV